MNDGEALLWITMFPHVVVAMMGAALALVKLWMLGAEMMRRVQARRDWPRATVVRR